jgi:hypothetical protein
LETAPTVVDATSEVKYMTWSPAMTIIDAVSLAREEIAHFPLFSSSIDELQQTQKDEWPDEDK